MAWSAVLRASAVVASGTAAEVVRLARRVSSLDRRDLDNVEDEDDEPTFARLDPVKSGESQCRSISSRPICGASSGAREG